MADLRAGAGEGNRTLVVSLGRLGRRGETKDFRHMPRSTDSEQAGNETRFSPTVTAGLPQAGSATSPTPETPPQTNEGWQGIEGDFKLRRYEVTVGHWGAGIFLATTRGKALADAWRSDAFEGYTFGEFLKMARCRLTEFQIKPVPITVLGKPAFKVDHNEQYVQFVYPNGEFVLNAHPLDVLPETERPRSYRTPTPEPRA